MKAILKADNRLIEVEERYIESYVVYYDSYMDRFYEPYELDFNIIETDEMIINREEYDDLCRYRRYCANWVHNIVICPHCGEFNPNGCVCINCGKDRHH